MSKFIDLTGMRFGKLLVTGRADNTRLGQTRWNCRCDCGNEKIIRGCHLKSYKIKSCGCLQLKHGHRKRNEYSKTYRAWDSMLQRCTNPNNLAYKDYGGRDKPITVCDRWNSKKGGSFENFLEDMGECPSGLSLDRINNGLGYFKENCRWTTMKEQERNRRDNHLISYSGKTQCLSAWAEEYNIKTSTLWHRLYKYGWSIEKALTTSVRKRG